MKKIAKVSSGQPTCLAYPKRHILSTLSRTSGSQMRLQQFLRVMTVPNLLSNTLPSRQHQECLSSILRVVAAGGSGGEGIVKGIVGEVGEAMGSDNAAEMGGGMRAIIGAVQGGEEEEMMGVIELLCLMVPGVRYWAPREPIPRSEFLFHHHVC